MRDLAIALRTLRAERRSLVLWCVGLAAFAVLMASFYPTVRDQAEKFQELLEAYPPAMQALVGGDMASFGSPAGYLRVEVFGAMAPLLFLIFAIGRGAAAVAGEEERGTMEMLLGHPVRRRDVVLQQALALAASTAILSGVLFAALLVGVVAFGMDIAVVRLAGGVLMLALLAFAFGAVALAVGAATGRRAAAVAAGAGGAAASYLLVGLAEIADWLDPWRVVSPWHYYLGGDPLLAGPDPVHVLVLAGLAAGAVAAGAWAFERRDVRR